MTSRSSDDVSWWGRLLIWSILIVFVVVPVSVIGIAMLDEIVRPTPEIVLELQQRDHDEFTRRLEAAFPPGMAESELVSGLNAQGFATDTDAREGRFVRSSIACSDDWVVNWTVDAEGDLATITGYDMGACL